jgi:hypothetical protein
VATTYKVLAQSAPSGATNTSIYTVPSSTSTVVSTITVCNRTASSVQYRIAVKPTAGTTLANEHYIAFNATVAAYDTVCLTLGLALAAGNNLVAFAGSSSLTFNVFGSEITE